jgi:protein TonB
MKPIIFFVLFIAPFKLFSQEEIPVCDDEKGPNPLADSTYFRNHPEEEAEFPGGATAFRAYICNNLIYPIRAKELGIKGKCYLQFVVARSGEISSVTIILGVRGCPECDEEAIRLIKAMPDWKPCKINGQPVNQTFNFPVVFNIPIEETNNEQRKKN